MKGCYFEYLFHTNNEYYLVGLQDNSLSWGWFKQKICVVFNEIRSQHNVFLAAFLICLSGVLTCLKFRVMSFLKQKFQPILLLW